MRSVRVAIALVLGFATSASAQPPLLHLDHLSRLAGQAHNVVDITLDAAMLQMASSLLPSASPTDIATKALVAGLKGVSVKSFEFDQEGVYSDADIEAVRAQLTAPWGRVVSLNTREARQHVEVYMWHADSQPDALLMVLTEPKKLTVVNIIGHIDLTQLAGLGGVLGIPPGLPGIPAVGSRTP